MNISISLMSAGSLESLLDDVGEVNLVAAEEAGHGISLGLAEALLLRGRQLLPLISGCGTVALGEVVIGLNVSLISCLHFRLFYINYNH